MKEIGKILACVDFSQYARIVVFNAINQRDVNRVVSVRSMDTFMGKQ